MSEKCIVVVGSANADCFINVSRLPLPGETVKGYREHVNIQPGGKGLNQAVAASRLGYSTHFIGMFGDDANGHELLSFLQTEGVDVSLSRTIPSVPSGSALIFSYPNGDNSILIIGGANEHWSIPEAFQIFVDSVNVESIVLLQCEIPFEINLIIAQLAFARGLRVVMDLGGEDVSLEKVKAISVYLHVLSPNETELKRLSGLPTDSIENVVDACHALKDSIGNTSILVKRGIQGSLYESNGEVIEIPVVKVPSESIKDTTGAGDCFTASFACKLMENFSIDESMQFATQCASICIQSYGAANSFPSKK